MSQGSSGTRNPGLGDVIPLGYLDGERVRRRSIYLKGCVLAPFDRWTVGCWRAVRERSLVFFAPGGVFLERGFNGKLSSLDD